MAVYASTSFASSLLEKLKAEEDDDHCRLLHLPSPRPWESIPSESGAGKRLLLSHSSTETPKPLYETPIVSESSLVRLAINALQGMESALLTIEKLCIAFNSNPADRTFHRISSIWKRTSSTLALGNILKSIGCSGCIVFLLHKFVDHFANLMALETEENQNSCEGKMAGCSPQSLVNQAFSAAVRKLLEGFVAAVDTLYASVDLRRSSETVDISSCSSFGLGCTIRSEHSEVTLLEVYLHSKELRSQLEVIGNFCHIRDIAFCFSEDPFEDLISKAKSELFNFPRGGDLLTYLYTCLRVADPVHSALIKFLFLRSCEPYFEFIRSWMFTAKVCDPYKEFIVEHAENLSSHSPWEGGSPYDVWLATVKERDGVVVPCFLKDMSCPIIRAGVQLQVVMKLFELCGDISTENGKCSDILPCWSDFSVDDSSDASPFSFNRGRIEAMVVARNNYYRRMTGKMDIILQRLRPRFQQVVSNGNLAAKIGNLVGSNDIPILLCKGGRHISSSVDNKDEQLVFDDLGSEASSRNDDFSYLEHQLDSSDCSSWESSEEQNESGEFIQLPNCLCGVEKNYLSALDILSSSSNNKFNDMIRKSDTFNPGEDNLTTFYDITDSTDIFTHHNLTETNLSDNYQSPDSGKPNLSLSRHNLWETESSFCGLSENSCLADRRFRHDTIFRFSESGLTATNKGVSKDDSSYLMERSVSDFLLTNKINDKDESPRATSLLSGPFNLQLLDPKSQSNPLSMNPVLFRSDLIWKHDESFFSDHTNLSSSFNFSSVKDPCKVHENNLVVSRRHYFGAESTVVEESNPSAAVGASKFSKDCYDDHAILVEKIEFPRVNFSLASVSDNKEDGGTLANVSGGSSWESMLGSLGNSMDDRARVCQKSVTAEFEIPLDYAIEKCLLQEILHQYWYISKLTIKLLEEGFNLREHLAALQRYHFMELADWADLFIVSLWHLKWQAVEADRKVSEIQELLTMSLQKSSCERDDCKDRLFVYMKENRNNIMPLLVPRIGIDLFNFLGLGYKVDWPVSIVLKPGALEIYSLIFSFLLRVKLAIFSLTNTWCSLKDLLHFSSQSSYSKAQQLEVHGHRLDRKHLNTLTTIRHQLNHFVTTLQQYVQSQLSHVSWCRFTDSNKNQVKDMMDLQSLHMDFLIHSLHICFLSDEMKNVASIIENILQCALDLHYCLIEANHGGDLEGGFPSKLCRIDISQVLAVKQAFEKNLVDLHTCYLKAPKHSEFGLARLWNLLNYNEYYSDLINEQWFGQCNARTNPSDSG